MEKSPLAKGRATGYNVPMVAEVETNIWQRILEPSWEDLNAEAAQGLLRLKFRQKDIDRMNELAALAREGALSADQRQEIETYERIGCMLAIIQSKARSILKQPAGS